MRAEKVAQKAAVQGKGIKKRGRKPDWRDGERRRKRTYTRRGSLAQPDG